MTEIRPRLYVPFECTGRVRRAFAQRGWFAVSCDLKPTELPCGPNEYHHIGDARDLLDPEWLFGVGWNMMIAFPPCPYLTNSAEWAYGDGPYHQKVKPGTLVGAARRVAREDAIKLAAAFIDAEGIEYVAVENPIGVLSTRIREPDQIIHPNQYGHDASKSTCLWLKKLPRLRSTKSVMPRTPRIGRKRWANQTDSGQNRLSPSAGRAAKRAETYLGVSDAMGDQWCDPSKFPPAWHQQALFQEAM